MHIFSLMRTLPLCALLCAAAFVGTAYSPAHAAPLLLEGKKTLFQRVISHPNAQLLAQPAANAAVVQSPVKTFSVFYVYAREKGWLQVGTNTTQPQGWLQEGQTTAWNQTLTLMFTPRTGRDPVLFFNTGQELEKVCSDPAMEARLAALHKQAAEQKADASSPVIAAEPADAKGAVAQEHFYLMPILSTKDAFEGVKFLEVASIDPGAGKQDAKAKGGAPRTGIVFVLDTTISMKPYIEQSLAVIRSIYDGIAKDKMADNVGFAVVAFRSSTSEKPEVGYVAKVISDFTTVKNREQLESALAAVEEAKVSTPSFNEDALAGVKMALDDLSWGDYSSRLLILISDAGPLPASDKNASVRMDVAEMNDYARSKGVWITAMHIKSPAGAKDHASAAEAYKKLARLSSGKANYQAIPAPDPQQGAKHFGNVAKALTGSIVSMVKNTAEGKIMTRPKDEKQAPAKPEDAAAQMAASLGYAMQLEWLGKQHANTAPQVVKAWIADMDLRLLAQGQPAPAVEVAVLLTKNQLSDLSQQVKLIIDNAERTKKTDSKDFFQGILAASARMARDPNAPTQGKNLAELGVLGEFLDGLPYKSDIMLLREEDWYRMSIGEQTAFVNRLKSRLARYEEYDKDSAHWESFGSPNTGDWVYRVPLSMLP
ncbi:MAG: VWA domain-containing protein [Desulfovibrionaceae bacterium]|nr:VWA domain-containing protein [Desulfovibrionaceae bacterium]